MSCISGVTAATERVSYGVWEEIPAVISPARYLQAVQARSLEMRLGTYGVTHDGRVAG